MEIWPAPLERGPPIIPYHLPPVKSFLKKFLHKKGDLLLCRSPKREEDTKNMCLNEAEEARTPALQIKVRCFSN